MYQKWIILTKKLLNILKVFKSERQNYYYLKGQYYKFDDILRICIAKYGTDYCKYKNLKSQDITNLFNEDNINNKPYNKNTNSHLSRQKEELYERHISKKK